MKRTLILIIVNFCALLSYAQNIDFVSFQKLFKKVETPFSIDSCSIQNLAILGNSLPKINKKMRKYIPDSLFIELMKEQKTCAFFNIPINKNYISLVIYAGSYNEDDILSNCNFYIVNYDTIGNIIDYIKIAGYKFESGNAWCSISENIIKYISFEPCKEPLCFAYDIHEVIPMIEERYEYIVDMSGHFVKKVLLYRKGLYKPTYDGCYFVFTQEFPNE